MVAAKARPLVRGNSMSSRATAYGVPACAAARSLPRQSLAVPALSLTMCQLASCRSSTARVAGVWSTIKARNPRVVFRLKDGSSLSTRRLSKFTSNQKIDPCVKALSTPIVPPISSTSCFEIVKPRPVPPCLRVVEPSACENDSKMRVCASLDTPMPVSCTSKRKPTLGASSLHTVTFTVTLPVSVNLMALPSRLTMIWRKRFGSPQMAMGMSNAISNSRLMFFACACGANTCSMSSSNSRKLKRMYSTLSLPASILEKSRMSLMITSKFCPERCTMLV